MTMPTASDLEARVGYLNRFESAQVHVRRRFALPERDEEALRRVASAYNPPEWAEGYISVHDAVFLNDLIRGIRPRRVIELGVGSGTSTVVLLSALREFGLAAQGALQSFDIRPFCYFDPSKPVGCLVGQQVPELAAAWTCHIGRTARDAGRMFSKEKVSFAFIDADHRHPATTADLLWLLPALAAGAWVALHDIDLPNVALAHEERTGAKVDWHHRGAKELFDGWPWEKVRGGTVGKECGGSNIGAIRVPAGVKSADLAPIVAKKWETNPDWKMRWVLRARRGKHP